MLKPTWINKLLQFKLIRFALVGGIGFIVDAGVLLIAHLYFNLNLARLISISAAITCTWALNRIFTFQSSDPGYKSEWMRYSMVCTVGSSLSYFGFITLTHLSNWLYQYPIVPLAIVSVLTAFFNYYFSQLFAFKQVATE